MWAIIYPVLSMPLVISLLVAARRARKRGDLDNLTLHGRQRSFRLRCLDLFWALGKHPFTEARDALLIVPYQM